MRGWLRELDQKSALGIYPLNLVTALEISVKPDGTINQVIISRQSGVLPFDTAALESVHRAAPFPAPPSAIKSRDDNVYVTWLFHRDNLQCATDFVSAHILTTPARSTPTTPAKASPPATTSSEPGRPGQPIPPQPARTHLVSGGKASPTGATSSPRSAMPPAETSSPPAASAKNANTVPDEACSAAERWLTGYRTADMRGLTGSSAVPFTVGGRTVAENGASLRSFYLEMLADGTPKQDRVRYYTVEQITQLRGSLPRGGNDNDTAFAWVELGGKDLILILQPASKGWRVVGLDR